MVLTMGATLIHPGLRQWASAVGVVPDGVRADAVPMPGTGAKPRRAAEVPFQKQADEPGRERHRPVGEHVRLGKFRRTKGAIKLHLLLDHDGYLPSFAVVTEGKTSEIKVARTLRFAAGTILAIDRGYIDYEWFRELTQEEVYFVTRMKEKAVYEVKEELQVPQNSHVVRDQIICFPRLKREGEEPVLFRRVEIWDAEKQEAIVFLCNLLAFGATTIAAIYKDRWQVELFFQALQQTLKIKTSVGTSANAVRTQVWTALIAMLVLTYLQLKSKFSWSLSTLAALLRQQLFFYRDLWAWLDDPFQAPPALAGVHDDAQQLEITW